MNQSWNDSKASTYIISAENIFSSNEIWMIFISSTSSAYDEATWLQENQQFRWSLEYCTVRGNEEFIFYLASILLFDCVLRVTTNESNPQVGTRTLQQGQDYLGGGGIEKKQEKGSFPA